MIDYNTFFTNKTILITGGSGSFGQAFIYKLLQVSKPKKVIVFSRDEWKHSQMQDSSPIFRLPCLRYFLGDIRDKERLYLAFRDVDYIVHAAALKQVPVAEYNPTEFIKTNIIGTMNVLDVAISSNVKRVIALSTDKAAAPVNLYGATKLCADKLILSGKVYVGDREEPKFSVVRYGNVLGSKGSLVPRWQKLIKDNAEFLPITDGRMTRFWITMEQAAEFVMQCFVMMKGEEIFVPKLPSMKIADLAKVLAPHLPLKTYGIRPGEKLHEHLITQEEAKFASEYPDHYVVKPNSYPNQFENGVGEGFEYRSDNNKEWLGLDQLQQMLVGLE